MCPIEDMYAEDPRRWMMTVEQNLHDPAEASTWQVVDKSNGKRYAGQPSVVVRRRRCPAALEGVQAEEEETQSKQEAEPKHENLRTSPTELTFTCKATPKVWRWNIQDSPTLLSIRGYTGDNVVDMAYGDRTLMAYVVIAYVVMAYIVKAYIVMAYIVMAYTVMAQKCWGVLDVPAPKPIWRTGRQLMRGVVSAVRTDSGDQEKLTLSNVDDEKACAPW